MENMEIQKIARRKSFEVSGNLDKKSFDTYRIKPVTGRRLDYTIFSVDIGVTE